MKRFSFVFLFLMFSSLIYAITPITPVVLVDNSECMMKVVAYEEDSWSFTLKAQCENKSKDKTYTFSITDSTVNGLMEYSSGYAEVPPKKRANVNISFYGLKKDGISKASDILLFFRVYDTNDWLADPVAMGQSHVYPYGEQNKDKYIRFGSNNDKILLSKVDVKLTLYESKADKDLELKVFLENKTGKEVMFSIDDASVNGYVVDPYWAKSVLPNSMAYSSINWSQRMLEENLIFSVDDIEFTIRVSDYEDWLAPLIAEENVILNFN